MKGTSPVGIVQEWLPITLYNLTALQPACYYPTICQHMNSVLHFNLIKGRHYDDITVWVNCWCLPEQGITITTIKCSKELQMEPNRNGSKKEGKTQLKLLLNIQIQRDFRHKLIFNFNYLTGASDGMKVCVRNWLVEKLQLRQVPMKSMYILTYHKVIPFIMDAFLINWNAATKWVIHNVRDRKTVEKKCVIIKRCVTS